MVATFKFRLTPFQRQGLGGKSGYVLFKVFLLDLALTVIFVLVNVAGCEVRSICLPIELSDELLCQYGMMRNS